MGLKKRSRHLQSQAFSKIGLNVNLNKKKYVKGSRTLSGRQWKWGNLKKNPSWQVSSSSFIPMYWRLATFNTNEPGKFLPNELVWRSKKVAKSHYSGEQEEHKNFLYYCWTFGGKEWVNSTALLLAAWGYLGNGVSNQLAAVQLFPPSPAVSPRCELQHSGTHPWPWDTGPLCIPECPWNCSALLGQGPEKVG